MVLDMGRGVAHVASPLHGGSALATILLCHIFVTEFGMLAITLNEGTMGVEGSDAHNKREGQGSESLEETCARRALALCEELMCTLQLGPGLCASKRPGRCTVLDIGCLERHGSGRAFPRSYSRARGLHPPESQQSHAQQEDSPKTKTNVLCCVDHHWDGCKVDPLQ
eukprot:3978524-Amphidinium_carterae.1